MNKGYVYIGSLVTILILFTGIYKIRDYRTQIKGTIVAVTLVKIPGGPGSRGTWVDFQYGGQTYREKMRRKDLRHYTEGMHLPMKHIPGSDTFVPVGKDVRGELVIGGLVLLMGAGFIYKGVKKGD